MSLITIYGIEFAGKIMYVGQTQSSMQVRWWRHMSNARTGRDSCPHLYRHMRKHSLIGYKEIELERCAEELAAEREMYWIAHHKAFGEGGLNCHPGGNQTRGVHHYLHGKTVSRHIVEASVKARRGTKHSAEHIEKIRAANTGKKQPVNYIRIVCDQNGKTYESQDAASKDLGILKGSVSEMLRGKTAIAGGFTFKYADHELEAKRKIKVVKPHWTTRHDAEDIKKSMRKPHKKRK